MCFSCEITICGERFNSAKTNFEFCESGRIRDTWGTITLISKQTKKKDVSYLPSSQLYIT